MKKIILLLTSLLLSAATSFAQTVATGTTGDCTWTLTGPEGNYTLTISGNGAMADYTSRFRPSWNSYQSSITQVSVENGVTNIGNYAFDFCSSLTSVTIGSSVTSIGNYAFYRCSGLTSVTIPNSVESIGNYAFYRCSGLTSVTIPNSVESIGNEAFSGCTGLTSVTIGSSVTSIWNGTFSNCTSLASVTIGNSVTSIGYDAFSDCTSLTDIIVEQGNAYYSSDNGVLFNRNKTTLVRYPVGKAGAYSIPNSVTSIGNYAFYDCTGLTSVTIPNSVTSIELYAFSDCSSLTDIIVEQGNAYYSSDNGVLFNLDKTTLVCYPGGRAGAYSIPNSVTSIRGYAFSLCTGLTSITIPNSVTSIGGYAFSSCSGLTSVTIGNSVISIGEWAFSYCTGLTSVTIGNSVISIGEWAFSYCTGLTSITIPNSVTRIGNDAFSYCSSLTNILVENGSAYYSSDNGVLFNLDKTTLIQYPAGKSDISYVIPNSVTSIGYSAFERTSLISVTIPSSVESIGNLAFSDCTGLTEVTNLNPTPQSIASYVFYNVDLSKVTLYVPAESIAAYEAASVWKNFGTIAAYVPAAIDAPAGESDLWVYPNPVRDSFRIKGLAAPALVEVTDLSGKIIWKQTVTGSESIPASHWPAGVYLLRVQGQTLKVVKN